MKRKLISIILCLAMCCSLFSVALAAGTEYPDMPGEDYWSYPALKAAVENGLLQGDDRGNLDPRGTLTRAQMAAVVNRAFGAKDSADISAYSDVPLGAWYYGDMARAVRMGTFRGDDSGLMRPNDPITREQAFAVLARAFLLEDGDEAVLADYPDASDISAYARGPMAALVAAGYIRGTQAGLEPKASITREAFAQVFWNMLKDYIRTPGEYSRDVAGNLMVNVPGVILKDMKIAGDLIVGEGVGSGDLTLDGVEVTGRLVVRGGGENSIILKNNSGVGSARISKTGDGGVRLRSEEGCRIEAVYVDDNEDRIILEGEFNQIVVDTDATVILRDAQVVGLTLKAEDADVLLQGETEVTAVKVEESAGGAALEVSAEAKVAVLESEAEAAVFSGEGVIETALVSGDNTAVNTKGTSLTVDEGAKGVTENAKVVEAGETVITERVEAGDSGTGTETGGTAPAAHTHSWVLAAAVDATEEAEGYELYTCSCGESYTRVIPKLEPQLGAPCYTAVYGEGEDDWADFDTLAEAIAFAAEYDVTHTYEIEEGVETIVHRHADIFMTGEGTIEDLILPEGYSLYIDGKLHVTGRVELAPQADLEEGHYITAGDIIVRAPTGALYAPDQSVGFYADCDIQMIGEAPAEGEEEEAPYNGYYTVQWENYVEHDFISVDVRVNKDTRMDGYFVTYWVGDEKKPTITVASGVTLEADSSTLIAGLTLEEDAKLILWEGNYLPDGIRIENSGEMDLYGWIDLNKSEFINNGVIRLLTWEAEEGDVRNGGISLNQGSTLTNNGAILLDGLEDGPASLLHVCGGELLNSAGGCIENDGGINVLSGGCVVNEGSLVNRRDLNVYPGQDRTVAWGDDGFRQEETAAASTFSNTGTILNSGGMYFSGSAVSLGGEIVNKGEFTISDEWHWEYAYVLERTAGEPDWENDQVWGMTQYTEEGPFFWKVVSSDEQTDGLFPGSGTLSGTFLNEGQISISSAVLTLEEGARLDNLGSINAWKRGSEGWEGEPAAPELRIDGTLVNGDPEDESLWGNIHFGQGKVTIGQKGTVKNYSDLNLNGGTSLVNDGTLYNGRWLSMNPAETQVVSRNGEAPVEEQSFLAGSFVNNGSLRNVQNASINLRAASVTLGGSVVNEGYLELRGADHEVLNLSLGQFQGEPDWENEEVWGTWWENDQPYYWKNVGSSRTVEARTACAVTVSGSLVNKGDLRMANVSCTVETGATLENDNRFEIWQDRAATGEPAYPAPTLIVKGAFVNGAVTNVGEQNNGSWANYNQTHGKLLNQGSITNNGNMNLELLDYVQDASASMVTYNTGGLNFYSGSLTVPSGTVFKNEGYMSITDAYGTDPTGETYRACDLSGFPDFFTTWNNTGNDSRWCDYRAEVYDLEGFQAANAEQQRRIDALVPGGADNTYNQLGICGNITLAEDTVLDIFRNYWVNGHNEMVWQKWNEEEERWEDARPDDPQAQENMQWVGSTLTVPAGVTLTVDHDADLNVDGMNDRFTYYEPNTLAVEGKLVIAPEQQGSEENDWTWLNGGYVCIWSNGSFVCSSGEVENNGGFEVRYHEHGTWNEETWDADYDGTFFRPQECPVTGMPANAIRAAEVRTEAGLRNAASSYDRLYIRDNCCITVNSSLTVNAELNVEPGSGLIVEHGAALTLAGRAYNGGDISVYGDLIVDEYLDNDQLIEIGAVSGSEAGNLIVNGTFHNRNTVQCYQTGSVVLRAGAVVYYNDEDELLDVRAEGAPREARNCRFTNNLTLGEENWYYFENCVFDGAITLETGTNGTGAMFWQCAINGGITLVSGEAFLSAEFRDCTIRGGVTMTYAAGDEPPCLDFFNSCVFENGSAVSVQGTGGWSWPDEQCPDIKGAAGASVSAAIPVRVSASIPGGSFTLNGVTAELVADPGMDEDIWVTLWTFRDEQDANIFQVDSSERCRLQLSGSLSGYDELRIMQGNVDTTALSVDVPVSLSDMFVCSSLTLGAGQQAQACPVSPEQDGMGMEIYAGAGSTVYVPGTWMIYDAMGAHNYRSSQVSVNGYSINPHIFATQEQNDSAGVYIGIYDSAVGYELLLGEQSLTYEKEILAPEEKTHLWKAGDWFVAGPEDDPFLNMKITLPDNVTVVVEHIPVKPEWEEAAAG